MHEGIQGVVIGNDSLCPQCRSYMPFIPYGEEALIRQLQKAKKKKRKYDALVPLSGGKDSSYVLYLAVKVYKLNVLCFTFDNGFMSDLALRNIQKVIETCKVDHIWVKQDKNFLNELYRTSLLHSGEICGICGLGIERNMLKISQAWHIPLILLGHAPNEGNSFTSENLYDASRQKSILLMNKKISKEMIRRLLIYPRLNFISSYLRTRLGHFGKKLNILYYLSLPSDKQMSNILHKELHWNDSNHSKYTRHFDCLAEPLTNYIRDQRFGYSRRLPQLCNMIRKEEITKEEAARIAREDKTSAVNRKYDLVMERLNINMKDITHISEIPVNVFNDQVSIANRLFAFTRKILKGK